MFYLKLFETEGEYTAYTADTSSFLKPNVSYIEYSDNMYYTPAPQPQTRWVDDTYTCVGYDKYAQEKEQISYDDGVTWVDTGNVSATTLIEHNSEDCGYIPPQTRWVDDGYTCVGCDKYTQEKEQISYDGGETWSDTGNISATTLVEAKSSECGYRTQTTSGTPYCNGFDKYVDVYSQESCDGGTTWETTATTPTIIEHNSEDCGFNPCSVECVYDITDTSTNSKLCNNTSSFTEMFIDGVEQQSVISEYTFETTGEHTVLYIIDSTKHSINNAFSGCTNITSVNIGSGVTIISVSAFKNCTNIINIDIPDSVIYIGDYSFSGCTSLTSVDMPSGLTSSTGQYTFANCTSLTSVTIPSRVTDIGSSSFYNCTSLTSVTIPNSVTRIYSDAFKGCSGMTSCTIGSGVTKIDRNAFSGCTNIININIPSGVTSIGDNAFYGCSSLTSIDIPNKVTSIGGSAFYGCGSLSSCTIGSGVTTINTLAFSKCASLSSITVNSNNATYDSRNNCNAIIETSTNNLIFGGNNTIIPNTVTSIRGYAFYYCSGLTSIVIPDSVTSIGTYAFEYCSGLTSCTIGSGVTSINNYTFQYCKSLTSIGLVGSGASVEIPNTVTSIGGSVFAYCSGLTSVTIPDSVATISDNVFKGCSGLTTCTIGSGVTNISYQVFYDCTSLTSVVSNAMTAPTISSSTFKYIKYNGTLTVPQGSTGYDVWMGSGDYYLGKYNWTKVEQ